MSSTQPPTPFQILWTLNIAFDAAWYLEGATDLPRLAVLLATGLALLRPSPRAFATAWGAGIAAWLWLSPMTTNHSFTTLVGSTLALLVGAHRDGRAMARTGPVLVASVYGAAVLQKLNTTYLFDPTASCATALWRQFVDLPDAVAAWLAPLSLVLELAIGVGLLVPATRVVAAVFGTSFHLALGFHPLSPILLFSLTMIALYAASWPKGPALLPAVARLTLAGAVVSRVVVLSGAGLSGTLAAWASEMLVVLFVPVLFLGHRPDQQAPWPRARPWIGALAVVLPVLNTIPAHTGHRQFNSFDMYSNLFVDAAGSNHLFLPSLAWPHPATERVRVVEAEPTGFGGSVRLGDRVARVELVRTLRDGSVDRVAWTDAEGRHTWERGQPLPDDGIGWWDLKVRRLRVEPVTSTCVDCPTCRVSEWPE